MASRTTDEIRTNQLKRDGKSLKRSGMRMRLDQNHAQVLIEVGSELNTIEKARSIIEGIGVHIIEIQNLSPQRVLLTLDVTDMREVVLKLTQNGFLKIEGYNASSHPVG
jgi:hypothetical protein